MISALCPSLGCGDKISLKDALVQVDSPLGCLGNVSANSCPGGGRQTEFFSKQGSITNSISDSRVSGDLELDTLKI